MADATVRLVTCSWCHNATPAPPAGDASRFLCAICGHHAGRSRLECGCQFCAGAAPPRAATEADLDATLAGLPGRRRKGGKR